MVVDGPVGAGFGQPTDNTSMQLGTARVEKRLTTVGTQTSKGPEGKASIEDALVIERVKNGDTAAFGELVRKYQDRVFNACWRLCGNLEDAKDLTQEAFVKTLEAISSFRYQSAFYTWLFRVAVNVTISHRRSRQRRQTLSLDDAGGGHQARGLMRVVSDGNNPTDTTELNHQLVKAMQGLDDDHRAVLVLRDVEGFDYKQISEVLDIPQGTVKSRLFRSRMAMREAIQPWLDRQPVP